MDLIILIVLCIIVVFIKRTFSSFIYFIAFSDILMRIITFIKVQLLTGQLHTIISKYIPENIPAILANYSDGLLYTILLWLYVIGFIIFESYLIKSFFNRR